SLPYLFNYFAPAARTFTFTCRFVQQHWSPPPPSPLASFNCARRTHSPGSVKVAVVVAFPVKSPGFSNIFGVSASTTTIGVGGANVTAPVDGPRRLTPCI